MTAFDIDAIDTHHAYFDADAVAFMMSPCCCHAARKPPQKR